MRRFGFILAGVILLAACSSNSDATGTVVGTTVEQSTHSAATTTVPATPTVPAASQADATPAPTREPMAEADYLEMLDNSLSGIQQTIGVFDTETAAPNIGNPSWIGRIEGYADTITGDDSLFAVIAPPSKYAQLHQQWGKVIHQMATDASAVSDAAKAGSAAQFRSAVTQMKQDWQAAQSTANQVATITAAATPSPIAEVSPTTPTVVPTPTPEPTPQLTEAEIKAQYRGDVDVRDLYKNIAQYHDWKLTYAGTVLTIFATGNSTMIQVQVPYDTDVLDTKVIDVLFDGSVETTGIYEDTPVVIWGRPTSMFTITNVYGGQVDQPLLAGDFIVKQ